MSNPTVDVAVIGAGISGLSCAHFLRSRGARVVVLEKEQRAGGVIETRREDGYLMEVGPNSTLDSKPGLDRLVGELGLTDRLRYASPAAKNRFILRGGKLHALPMAPPGLVATRLFSVRGKLRIAGETLVRRRREGDDETVADFVRRRFGPEFLDYAIAPFVSGVYAGDPERLSLRSAFPIMYEFEHDHGGVIRGAMKTAKERKARRAARGKSGPSRLVSFDEGMAALTRCLAEGLAESLVLGAHVSSVWWKPGEGVWEVTSTSAGETKTILAAAVVVAAPASVAAELVAPLDGETATLLRSIPYAPVASVFCAWDRSSVSHALDGFGFLVPGAEGRDILGTIFSSSLFDGRAPEGKVALTTFVGGTRRPELVGELDDEAIVRTVVGELRAIVGVTGDPELFRVCRWERAIPQYVVGHRRVVDAIADLEKQYSGLFFCTNYQRGVSVGDCIDHAAAVADRIKTRPNS